jgi:hypothetical protein
VRRTSARRERCTAWLGSGLPGGGPGQEVAFADEPGRCVAPAGRDQRDARQYATSCCHRPPPPPPPYDAAREYVGRLDQVLAVSTSSMATPTIELDRARRSLAEGPFDPHWVRCWAAVLCAITPGRGFMRRPSGAKVWENYDFVPGARSCSTRTSPRTSSATSPAA